MLHTHHVSAAHPETGCIPTREHEKSAQLCMAAKYMMADALPAAIAKTISMKAVITRYLRGDSDVHLAKYRKRNGRKCSGNPVKETSCTMCDARKHKAQCIYSLIRWLVRPLDAKLLPKVIKGHISSRAWRYDLNDNASKGYDLAHLCLSDTLFIMRQVRLVQRDSRRRWRYRSCGEDGVVVAAARRASLDIGPARPNGLVERRHQPVIVARLRCRLPRPHRDSDDLFLPTELIVVKKVERWLIRRASISRTVAAFQALAASHRICCHDGVDSKED
eukprot:6183377-Pleurochrysis_carterae.AAC.3